MGRTMPPDRFEQLVDCATRVFIERGYARTQMADVAAALGVAKGTLYLYVESKEALFDTVARLADAERPLAAPPVLPIPTPAPGATLQYIRERVARAQVPPSLTAAMARQRVRDVGGELRAIAAELYDTLASNRRGITLVDRSARDYPELAAIWLDTARGGLIGLLTQYLDDRARRQTIRPYPDTTVVARLVLEMVVFWAVHRHWDAHPRTVDDAVAKETVVRFVVGALTKE